MFFFSWKIRPALQKILFVCEARTFYWKLNEFSRTVHIILGVNTQKIFIISVILKWKWQKKHQLNLLNLLHANLWNWKKLFDFKIPEFLWLIFIYNIRTWSFLFFFLFLMKAVVYGTGCPKKHGNSVTNSISS